MKVCSRCGEAKELSAFSRRAASHDGLAHRCRECAHEVYRAANEHRKLYRRGEELTNPTEKDCPRCGLTLPVAAFARASSRPDGLQPQCRECHETIRSEDPDRVRKNRDWYREKGYLRGLARRSGITPERYLEMLEAQGGRCAICRQEETRRSKDGRVMALTVDHDHATGRVRALLCSRCNAGIGYLRHDPALVELAAGYLRAHA